MVSWRGARVSLLQGSVLWREYFSCSSSWVRVSERFFWYQLTRVVPVKGLLCVSVFVTWLPAQCFKVFEFCHIYHTSIWEFVFVDRVYMFYYEQKSREASRLFVEYHWLVHHLTSHLRDQNHHLSARILGHDPDHQCPVPAFRGNHRHLLGHKQRKTYVLDTGRFCLRICIGQLMKFTRLVKLMKVLLNARFDHWVCCCTFYCRVFKLFC